MADIRFDEYKALVIVMLEGGSDSFNMIAPSDSAHAAYADVRGSLALTTGELLPLNNNNTNGLNSGTFGIRSNMTDMQTMFNSGELAIMANVGVLKEPTIKADIVAGTANLPGQLYSHNSQQALWYVGNSTNMPNGWAARSCNEFYPTPNPHMNISYAGTNLTLEGGIAQQLVLKTAFISTNTMLNYGYGPDSGGAKLGGIYDAMYEDAQSDVQSLLAAAAFSRVYAMDQHEDLIGLFNNKTDFVFGVGSHEIDTPLGTQLEYVAETLSVKDDFPDAKNRHIFFVKHRGWDTHAGDVEQKASYLSESLGEFNAAMKTLGLHDVVTTITMSEFGRSLTSNGPGTDHGWGGHAYMMGGAVKGKDIYGQMPELSATSDDSHGGRIIPTTAQEPYVATALKWMGATDTELNTIFPNLSAFPTSDMGFMETGVTNHIINGDFSDGTIDNITSSEATIVYDNGRLKVTGVSITYPEAQVSNGYFTGLEIGKTYRVSASFDNTGSGGSRGRIRIYSSGGTTQRVFYSTGNNETGDWVCDDTAPLVAVSLYESTVAGVSVWFDDLVFYEV